MTSRKIGLARALSKLGYCSRSQAFDLIRGGRVRLNGGIRRDPEAPVSLGRDEIAVDGWTVAARKKMYLMLNKPRGVITTASDEKGRATVYNILDRNLPWVAPVGRLDKASEGLLLLTNDSEWGARVLDPKTHLDKIYHVHVGTVADADLIDRLLKGITTQAGESLRVKHARILRSGEKNTWMEILLDEGRNRQIRRIFEQLGIEVLRLVRVAIGPLTLGELPKGSSRRLTVAEMQALNRAMHASNASPMRVSGDGIRRYPR